MIKELEKQNCRVSGIYVCPHHLMKDAHAENPNQDVTKGCKDYSITLHNSYVMGTRSLI